MLGIVIFIKLMMYMYDVMLNYQILNDIHVSGMKYASLCFTINYKYMKT